MSPLCCVVCITKFLLVFHSESFNDLVTVKKPVIIIYIIDEGNKILQSQPGFLNTRELTRDVKYSSHASDFMYYCFNGKCLF